MPATYPTPRRRSRRRGRPSSQIPISRMPTQEPRDSVPEWNDPLKAEDFYDNYQRVEGLHIDVLEYYCGICGEAVSKPKFAAHSLNHLHDVFEVRKGEVDLGDREEKGCGQCQGIARQIRALVQVIEDAINR